MRVARVAAAAVFVATALLALLGAATRLLALPEGLQGTYFDTVDGNSPPVRSTIDSPPSTATLLAAWDSRPPNAFSTTWTGSFVALRDGKYTFGSTSDDGSWVFIDGRLVVDNGGRHGATLATGSVHLGRGVHAIYIRYFQAAGPFSFALSWSRDDASLGGVAGWALTPRRPTFGRFIFSLLLRFLFTASEWLWMVTGAVALVATLWVAWLWSFPSGAPSTPGIRALAARDVGWAVSVGLVALCVYVRTLAPGLFHDIDTPMFQFIGRVLGVAHNPGYPLYVLITYPFSYLPIGSLAYRINLFSALMGALTVALVFLIARQLGCRRAIALGAAFGLAFGDVFWSQSVIAEVYTMNTAIIGGMLVALLAWSHSRRPAHFFLATALFSLGLAHHTDIVGFLPGMAVYALLVDRRFVLKAKTLASVAALFAAGLSFYLFILIRSRQPDAYVESSARTLGELAGVVLGRQFGNRLFVFSVRSLIYERVPVVVSHVLVPEMTVPALFVAMAGMCLLLRRAFGQGVLFLGGCAAIVGFALNYYVPDTPVFLIPALLVLWIWAAVGAEYCARVAERRSTRIAAAVAVACLALPVWNVSRNFRHDDHSANNVDQVYFDRLFAALPPRSFIVKEDFLVDRMVMYELLGEQAARGRQIVLAPPGDNDQRVRDEAARGFDVFAFEGATDRLRKDGFDFVPFVFPGDTLSEFFSHAPAGTTVALAVPAAYSRQFSTAVGMSLASIGRPDMTLNAASESMTIVGVRGSPSRTLARTGDEETSLDIAPYERNVTVTARADEAAVRDGANDIVRTADGVAMAVWTPDGTLDKSVVLLPSNGFRLPAERKFLAMSRLRRASETELVTPK